VQTALDGLARPVGLGGNDRFELVQDLTGLAGTRAPATAGAHPGTRVRAGCTIARDFFVTTSEPAGVGASSILRGNSASAERPRSSATCSGPLAVAKLMSKCGYMSPAGGTTGNAMTARGPEE
jgi:hypothetical protein